MLHRGCVCYRIGQSDSSVDMKRECRSMDVQICLHATGARQGDAGPCPSMEHQPSGLMVRPLSHVRFMLGAFQG